MIRKYSKLGYHNMQIIIIQGIYFKSVEEVKCKSTITVIKIFKAIQTFQHNIMDQMDQHKKQNKLKNT